jgi:hypothetical protein
MPAKFLECMRSPGTKKFTKKLPKGRFIRGCKRKGGKAMWGEVHKKKT